MGLTSNRALIPAVRATLQNAGYQVVDGPAGGGAPVVECEVQEFDFKNYTWLFPIVPTWGDIRLELRVVDPDGRKTWQKQYAGSSWNLWYSFGSAVNRSMGEILDQVAHDVSRPDFQRSCCGEVEAVAAGGV